MNLLQTQGLSGTLPPVSTDPLNERVRLRLKAEKSRRHLSERDIGQLLNWSQSKVAQKFNGRTPITLEELEGLAFVLSIAPTELVRDQGLEFCAEMTPTELRILERIRQLPPDALQGLLGLLHVYPNTRIETRGATKSQQGRIKKVR